MRDGEWKTQRKTEKLHGGERDRGTMTLNNKIKWRQKERNWKMTETEMNNKRNTQEWLNLEWHK
jgi:hypothetical protein